jgi:hypothetical protein
VGSQRAELMRLHGKIWSKLKAEHPDVLGIVREAQVVEGSIFRRGLGVVPLVLLALFLGALLYKSTKAHVEEEQRLLEWGLAKLERHPPFIRMSRAARQVASEARSAIEREGSSSE